MSDPVIGIGLIGAGFIAEYHLAGLASAGGAVVHVVSGRTPARTRALAERFQIGRVTEDWRSVLADPEVGAVVVVTPDHTHEAIAVAAARAGKSILLQKPMAGSAAACERIIAAAREHGVDLQVSYMHRHFGEVARLRELLASDALGAIHSVRIRNATPGPDWGDWFFKSSAVGNGVVDQLGIHGIDLVTHLLGPITRVTGRLATLSPRRRLADGRVVDVEVADTACAIYELACGALVTHEMSMIERQGCDRFRLEVYGERGTVWLRTERGPFAAWLDGDPAGCWRVPAIDEPPLGHVQHLRWLESLRGDASPDHSALDALAAARVVEGLALASREPGAWVSVEGVDRQ
ncbi:MAG: Gfo/Idh/MocA family oxidoreductase [Ectothiorhodospiraceae bacterium]|nr:Gfo/Idh/MocA family oxidoreductase [Chromatiales bacterium]MCP5154090.1 Gfo/Idh/MocA family oxidoreductase [Ectothiorhodospiraceae bacterium]